MRRFCALFLVTACALAGCDLKRDAVVVRSYLPAPQSERASQPLDARAGRFEVAPQFAGKPLVWRLDETRYESDFYNELLAAPRALIMERTEQWFGLRGSTEQYRLAPPRYVLEAYVHELYGDMRRAPGQARLRVRFTLSAGGEQPQIVFDREYSESVSLGSPTPEALALGYGKAIDSALARLENDVRQLR